MSNGLIDRAHGRVWSFVEALATSDVDTTYEHILWVLILDSGDDSGGNHCLLPGFGQI